MSRSQAKFASIQKYIFQRDVRPASERTSNCLAALLPSHPCWVRLSSFQVRGAIVKFRRFYPNTQKYWQHGEVESYLHNFYLLIKYFSMSFPVSCTGLWGELTPLDTHGSTPWFLSLSWFKSFKSNHIFLPLGGLGRETNHCNCHSDWLCCR